jgi:hypothetical protein
MVLNEVKGSIDDPQFLDPTFPMPEFSSGSTAVDEVISEEAKLFREAAIFLYLLSLTKAPQYGNSWCKRGMSGIFYTIARKWDRLEQAFHCGTPIFYAPGEHIEETIKDAAVYFVKWVGYLGKHHPDVWHSMVSALKCDLNNLSESGVLKLSVPELVTSESGTL